MKKAIDVNILGEIIRIKHEDEDYVQRLENFINEKVGSLQEQQVVGTSLQIAVRALLVIADDCLSFGKEMETAQQRINDTARRMIEFIDRKAALPENG